MCTPAGQQAWGKGAQCHRRSHFATNCLGSQACKQDLSRPFEGTEPSGHTASSCLEFGKGAIHPAERKKPRINQILDSGEINGRCPSKQSPAHSNSQLCTQHAGQPLSACQAPGSLQSVGLVWGLTRTLQGRRAVVHGSLADEAARSGGAMVTRQGMGAQKSPASPPITSPTPYQKRHVKWTLPKTDNN